MNRSEIEELALAVTASLGRRGAGVTPGDRQLTPAERQDIPHESADIGWRMPIEGGGRREEGGVGTTGPVGPPPSSRLPPPSSIAELIDHTLLKAEATRGEIDALCDEAMEHRFAAVCVNGGWTSHCVARLRGSGVKVASVVGFPLGAMPSRAKAFEARQLVDMGADEIDMVAAIGRVRTGDWDYVEDDIAGVAKVVQGRTLKVILETAALETIEIAKGSALAKQLGAQFVKTSTGFHPSGGATVEAVALMRWVVGGDVGVKAAGGVRDCATALRLIAAGASRLGTSAGVALAKCVGAGALPLHEQVADPDGHRRGCRSASGGVP